MSHFLSHDPAGPNLYSFGETCLLQAAYMTTKFKDSGVLSGEGCHVHGAEFPTGGLWCILTRSAVGSVIACWYEACSLFSSTHVWLDQRSVRVSMASSISGDVIVEVISGGVLKNADGNVTVCHSQLSFPTTIRGVLVMHLRCP